MHFLDIVNPGQPAKRFELPNGVYQIGRGESCQIRLRHQEISERHAQLTLKDGAVTLADLKSSNGVVVNGMMIGDPVTIRDDSVIEIGPVLLRVSTAQHTAEAPAPAAAAAAATAGEPEPAVREKSVERTLPSSPATSVLPPAVRDPVALLMREVKNQIHSELIKRLDRKSVV